jgi:hypothetical protein
MIHQQQFVLCHIVICSTDRGFNPGDVKEVFEHSTWNKDVCVVSFSEFKCQSRAAGKGKPLHIFS